MARSEYSHTMWISILAAAALLMVTSAELLDKRSNVPVDEDKIEVFKSQFRQTLRHIIAAKWNETQPLVNKFKTLKADCESRFSDQESSCHACAESACEPELIDVLLKEGEKLFKRVVNHAIDWLVWNEITGFFGGTGKALLNWGGLKNMREFFEDLGKNVLRWNGWKDIGDSVEDLGKNVGKGIEKLGGHIEDTVEDLGKGLEGGIKDIGKGLEGGIKDIGKGLESGVKELGKGLEGIGKGIKNGVKDIGKTIHKVFVPRVRFRFRRVFGKKKRRSVDFSTDSDNLENSPSSEDSAYSLYRREIEPEVRECMERCDVCRPLLQPDTTAQIRSICEDEFVRLSSCDTFSVMMPKLNELFNLAMDDNKVIVSSVEYDLESWSLTELAFKKARITVYFEDGYQTYQSQYPFKVSEIPRTAALMAKEYWDLFMQL